MDQKQDQIDRSIEIAQRRFGSFQNPADALQDFAKRIAQKNESAAAPTAQEIPRGITSTFLSVPPTSIVTPQSAESPNNDAGGDGVGGGTKQVIIIDNGTANYYNISADFVGPV